VAVNVQDRLGGVSRGYATWKSQQRDRWNALPERTRMIVTGVVQALVAIAFAAGGYGSFAIVLIVLYGFYWMSRLVPEPWRRWALIVAALAISGVGSAVSVVAFMLARAGNPAHMAGSATGLVNCGGFLAGSVAILAAGLLLGHDGRTAVAFQHALLPMLGFTALSLVQLTRLRFEAVRAARA
jgi:MFS family permease